MQHPTSLSKLAFALVATAAVGLLLAQGTPPSAPAQRRFTMTAVGDVMLDRTVGSAIKRSGASSILAKVRDRLRKADVRFCNLESPLSNRGAHAPHDCVFRADPSTIKVLTDGGFNIVSVANNHMLNSGRRTMIDTLDILDKFGIKYAGCRRDRPTSWWPSYVRAGGMVLGFMAYSDMSFDDGSYNKVGPDLSKLKRQVSLSRRNCDLLIVSFHWGEEYQGVPGERQRKVARAAVDAGAGLILGHHPHVLEGMSAYRGAPILYSMGNFVFDQKQGERMESAIFELTYWEGGGWGIEAVPVVIRSPRFGPEYPPAERARAIAQRLVKLSAKVGTYPRLTKNNTVWLQVKTHSVAAGRAASGS
jgi:poly-gamma-glutamate synthesis protein (capsule biosynthesis protein)